LFLVFKNPGGSDKAKLEVAPMKRVEGRKANKVSARESVWAQASYSRPARSECSRGYGRAWSVFDLQKNKFLGE